MASPELFASLLEEARGGSTEALGQLIAAFRQYLLSIANQELADEVRAKLAPSDLVQDSCIEAQQQFDKFRGQTRQELLAWLRGILVYNLRNARRHYLETGKRRASLEISLNDGDQQDVSLLQVASDDDSPSQAAMAREEQVLVERALGRLPEHLRDAVLLRHRDHLSFAEIGQQMERSAEAARKLWARGIEQLQQELKSVHSASHDSQA